MLCISSNAVVAFARELWGQAMVCVNRVLDCPPICLTAWKMSCRAGRCSPVDVRLYLRTWGEVATWVLRLKPGTYWSAVQHYRFTPAPDEMRGPQSADGVMLWRILHNHLGVHWPRPPWVMFAVSLGSLHKHPLSGCTHFFMLSTFRKSFAELTKLESGAATHSFTDGKLRVKSDWLWKVTADSTPVCPSRNSKFICMMDGRCRVHSQRV